MLHFVVRESRYGVAVTIVQGLVERGINATLGSSGIAVHVAEEKLCVAADFCATFAQKMVALEEIPEKQKQIARKKIRPSW